MNRFRKTILYLIIIALTTFMLISITGLVIIKYRGEEIKSYAIASLNKQLAVKVEVEDAEVTIFKQFPHISIVFKNVTAYSASEFIHQDFPHIQSDTLFKARIIYLRFNIYDVLNGNYLIRRILAEDGYLTLLTDRSGGINYRLLRESTRNERSEHSIELELFKLKDFRFKLENIPNDIQTSGTVDDITLKGKFSSNKFDLTLSGSAFLDIFKRKGIIWLDHTPLAVQLSMKVNDSIYLINKGVLNLDDLKLETKGSIITGAQVNTDLNISGGNLNIKSVTEAMPHNIKKAISGYSPEGKADIQVIIKGVVSGIDFPLISADYKISRGQIQIPGKSEIILLGFTGYYSNGVLRSPASSSFSFRNISAKIGESSFSGNLTLENLITPYAKADLNGNIYAQDLNIFLDDSSFLFTRGIISPDLTFSSEIGSFSSFDPYKLPVSSISGKLEFENTGFLTGHNYPEITRLNGRSIIKDDIWLSELGIETPSGDLFFKGRIDHLLGRFVKKTSSLWAEGDIFSRHTDLSFLLTDTGNSTDSLFFSLPDRLFMKLKINLDNFKMNKFIAENMSATLGYKPGFLNISDLHLNTMEGSLQGYGGLIEDVTGDLIARTSCKLSGVNITSLFETFNNFSQDFITYQNLAGKISGSIELFTGFSPGFIPDFPEIRSEVAVIIKDGELKDFEPMKNLSRFIEVSELEHIKFQTLQNTFIIKNSKVYVPEMDIKSSAFNISASGTHGFDNYFDYKLKVNLSEILAKKAAGKRENNEFAVLEKGGERINLFFHISGTPDDFKIRYDRKEAVLQIREDIKTEKKELKILLHEELGMFKKQFNDSIIKERRDISPKFKFEWDEDEKDSLPLKDQGKKKETKDPFYKFDWD